MRLIDADQMAVDESEAYMSAQVQITDELKWLVNFAAHSKIQKLIADTPTVDAVPVVRCKDCTHEFGGRCSICWFQKRKPDDFCSYGERKDGETDGS
jgi:hypothetical protein